MHFFVFYILILFGRGLFLPASNIQNNEIKCKEAFLFVFDEFEVVNQINVCSDARDIPVQFESNVNMPVCDDTLCANVVLTVYIFIGTFLEERKLIGEFGDLYRDYKSKVSMLFPFKWVFFWLKISK